MSAVHVEFEVGARCHALVAGDDSVWLVMRADWWDLASWLWWWLTPSDRRAYVTLKLDDGIGGATVVRTRAVRVSRRHVRVRGRGL